MFCLGHIAFFCIGAYAEAILSANSSLPYLLVLLLSGVMSALVALVIFFPSATLAATGSR